MIAFFESIANLIYSVISFVVNLIESIPKLFSIIAFGSTQLISYIAMLPDFIVVIGVLSITAAVLFLIVGR